MAPKKKDQQKMSLGDFLTDSGLGGSSWADEVEESYGTQPLPPSDRPRPSGISSWQDRSYASRDSFPTKIPDKPPFTAHLGNLSYDATVDSVTEFFDGCDVVSVRIIEDREMQRPKGFGYVEFIHVNGLKKALDLDGQSFQGRMIRIKVADPPRGGDGRMESARDLTDWTRKGPLPDLPSRMGRQPSDFGERRPRDPTTENQPARELTWERRGPLSPLPQQDFAPRPCDDSRPRPAPEGLGECSESSRGSRQAPSASWGETRPEGSRPPRRDQSERVASAAEKDMQWRDRMRPDATSGDDLKSPPSPAMPSATPAPVGRPRLNLQKRTVSEVMDTATPLSSNETKASPFGAARPIDTATREKEIEERRQQTLREKREAEDKAKEERRLAKQEAVAKAETDAKTPEEAVAKETEEKNAILEEVVKEETESSDKQNGVSTEKKVPLRSREPREPRDHVPNYKSKPAETGNWRSISNDQRLSRGPVSGSRGGRGGGMPRGPRGEGRGAGRVNGTTGYHQSTSTSAPTGADAEAPKTVDEDGWTMVKKGRQGRPVVS